MEKENITFKGGEKIITYIVYEYNDNANPSYRGTRFMVVFKDYVKQEEDSITNIIAQNVSQEEAYILINEAKKDNMDSYYENLPDELKSDHLLDFLKSL